MRTWVSIVGLLVSGLLHGASADEFARTVEQATSFETATVPMELYGKPIPVLVVDPSTTLFAQEVIAAISEGTISRLVDYDFEGLRGVSALTVQGVEGARFPAIRLVFPMSNGEPNALEFVEWQGRPTLLNATFVIFACGGE